MIILQNYKVDVTIGDLINFQDKKNRKNCLVTGVEKKMAQNLSLIYSVKGRAIDHNFIQFKFRRISTF